MKSTNPGGRISIGTTPNYLYGICGSLSGANLTVGSTSGTAWKGIAGDRGTSSYGTSSDVLTMSGNMEAAALARGSFTINARISGGAPLAAELAEHRPRRSRIGHRSATAGQLRRVRCRPRSRWRRECGQRGRRG